jgi:hypothetical protein
MLVKIDRKFEKDLDKITDKKLIFSVIEVIEKLKHCSGIHEFPKIEKWKAFHFITESELANIG